MVNLKETAKDYQPKAKLNICDLDRVDLKWPIEERTGTDKDDKEYSYSVLVVNGNEFRVPDVVLGQIQEMLELKPDLEFVKVERTGSGVSTRYKTKVAN